jgi:hypothetical protein
MGKKYFWIRVTQESIHFYVKVPKTGEIFGWYYCWLEEVQPNKGWKKVSEPSRVKVKDHPGNLTNEGIEKIEKGDNKLEMEWCT